MSDKETPKIFYKYFSIEDKNWRTTLSALAGRYFWLADPSSFGDATDNPWSYSKHHHCPIFLFHNKIIRSEDLREIYNEIKVKREQEIEQDIPWSNRDRSLYDPIINRFFELYEDDGKRKYNSYLYDLQSVGDDELGICSFSDSRENLYLWDKYAGGHRGFCLGFELTEGSPCPVEVQYESNRPLRFELSEVLRSPKILWDSLNVKNTSFSAENEWRIIEYVKPLSEFLDNGASTWSDGASTWSDCRKFRNFRLVECILGVGFPVDLVDILTAVLPPHVVLGRAELPYLGEDGKMHFVGYGSGPPGYYLAGMDRKIIDKFLENQMVQVDPDEYENHGRHEGFDQIRWNKPIFRDFAERRLRNDSN